MILNAFILTFIQSCQLHKCHLRSFRRSVPHFGPELCSKQVFHSRQVFWVRITPHLPVYANLTLSAAEAKPSCQQSLLKTSSFLIASDIFICNTTELSNLPKLSSKWITLIYLERNSSIKLHYSSFLRFVFYLNLKANSSEKYCDFLSNSTSYLQTSCKTNLKDILIYAAGHVSCVFWNSCFSPLFLGKVLTWKNDSKISLK